MKIYIKDYLRKIPIIKEMLNMIVGYSDQYSDETVNNFDEFNKTLLTDNVAKFLDYTLISVKQLMLIFPEKTKEDLEIFRRNQINYLTKLFYSVKGTYKVLDYITEYDLFQTNKLSTINDFCKLQDTDTEINYTTQGIEIVIQSIPDTLDRDLFCEYLEKFLSNLLYFETLTIDIKNVNMNLNESTTTSLNHGDAYFQFYSATED